MHLKTASFKVDSYGDSLGVVFAQNMDDEEINLLEIGGDRWFVQRLVDELNLFSQAFLDGLAGKWVDRKPSGLGFAREWVQWFALMRSTQIYPEAFDESAE